MTELPVPGVTPGPDWAEMINDAIIARAKAIGGDIAAYRESVNVPATTTGVVTLDLSVANVFRLTPTGAVTIALSGAVNGKVQSFTLIVMNSTYAITWPAGTKFPNASAPTLNGVTWISGVSDEGNVLTVGASWSGVA